MKNRKKRWFGIIGISVLAVCLLVCIAAGLAIRFAPDLHQISMQIKSMKPGGPAPDFELASLDGTTVRLSQFKGRPVVLSFGASWCPDCRAEAPVLQNLHQTHPELVVMMVDSKEGEDVVRKYASEFGMTHPVLLDKDGTVSRQYQIYAIPTVFFIDSDGIVRTMVIETVTPKLLAERLPSIGVTP